jgi:dTDP-4-dehydrorhamnose 3,5-epimerase
MEIRPLRLEGTFEIILTPHKDDRGYFMRVFDAGIFRGHGLVESWVQENQSLSVRKNLVRGLHFQRPPHCETKLVRAILGAAYDVFVDLRRDSPTYGKWDALELSEERQNLVYIPKGFAHGFCTLSENVVMVYKVDAPYAPQFEDGLAWNDPELGIDWPSTSPYLSAKDSGWPLLSARPKPLL